MDRNVVDPNSLPTSAVKHLLEEAKAAHKAINEFIETRKFWGLSTQVWRNNAAEFEEQVQLWQAMYDHRMRIRKRRP